MKNGVHVLLLGIGIATLSASCAAMQRAGDHIVDCGKDAVKQEAINLLPAVVAILSGNSVDWADQLNALKGVSADALVCAVHAVATELKASPTPSPAVGRAKMYLKSYRVK